MGYDVFICYSTKDGIITGSICDLLEKSGIKCWIAPRNVCGGKPYVQEIIRGIENSNVMVLIHTKNSNVSRHVLSEIEQAFSKNKIIIPFLVDSTKMSTEHSFYLNRTQWIIAYPNYKKKIEKLLDALNNIFDTDKKTSQNTISNQSEGENPLLDYLKDECQRDMSKIHDMVFWLQEKGQIKTAHDLLAYFKKELAAGNIDKNKKNKIYELIF